jgi:hypothetical protein
VWARLFILDKQFKAAEGLYLEQNNLEAGLPETLSSGKKKNQSKCFDITSHTKRGCSFYAVLINTYFLTEKR